jgi:mono/diheme cytochrome c family protein
MTRLRFGIALAVVVASCGRPPEGRERRDFERMRQQQRYDAYEASRFFSNGAVVQAPPAHTSARDLFPPSGGSPAPLGFLTGSANGADLDAIPMPIDDRVRSLGAGQFAISCAPCHGAGGYGGGVMAPNMPGKRPPSLRVAPASALSPGMMFKVITEGFGRMPAYGWQMPPAARWAVIAYVKSLPEQPTSTATIADSVHAASQTGARP